MNDAAKRNGPVDQNDQRIQVRLVLRNPGVAVMRSERTNYGYPPRALVSPSMRLTELAKTVLEAVANVPRPLLDEATVGRSGAEALWFPWYPRKRGGGAFVVGRTIRFTSNWYAVDGPGAFGDGSRSSAQRWLLHLAHEVGHLPQAARTGTGLLGRVRYLLTFAWQYGIRAVLFRFPVHDGAPLERAADRGRWVLRMYLKELGPRHGTAFMTAVHAGDLLAVRKRLHQDDAVIATLHQRYGRSTIERRRTGTRDGNGRPQKAR